MRCRVADALYPPNLPLSSVKLEAPHAYYSMPLCTPPEGVHRSTLSPAMFLLGTESAPYSVIVMVRAGRAAGGGGLGPVAGWECPDWITPAGRTAIRALVLQEERRGQPLLCLLNCHAGLMPCLQTMQKGLAACNGPAYPGHAYPALTEGDVKVSRDRAGLRAA